MFVFADASVEAKQEASQRSLGAVTVATVNIHSQGFSLKTKKAERKGKKGEKKVTKAFYCPVYMKVYVLNIEKKMYMLTNL